RYVGVFFAPTRVSLSFTAIDYLFAFFFFRLLLALRVALGRGLPDAPPALGMVPGRDGILPDPIAFSIFAICFRPSISWFTCCTEVPLPAAMRLRLEASIACGTRRSCGVIERM